MSTLFLRAEVAGRIADVRVAGDVISDVSPGLRPGAAESVVDARGGALLPGLHDHHIHLLALASARASTRLGPPAVRSPAGFDAALRAADAAAPPGEWLRGVGYDEAVAGPLDARRLDALVAHRPVRVQHCSGAMWVVNTAALHALGLMGADWPGSERGEAGHVPVIERGEAGHRPLIQHSQAGQPPGIERDETGQRTGRLFRLDALIRDRVPVKLPDLRGVGAELLRYGLTGLTDATPTERPDDLTVLASAVARGELPQQVVVTGGPGLDPAATVGLDPRAAGLAPHEAAGLAPAAARLAPAAGLAAAAARLAPGAAGLAPGAAGLAVGPVKLVIADQALPSLDDVVAWMRAARRQSRTVAVHCVTREALVLALAGWSVVGAIAGDRVEHASVVTPELAARMAELGLTVVTQPAFVADRGDRYLDEVDEDDVPHLYPWQTLLTAGVPVAGSSDAPFGDADPWRAMAAAMARRAPSGRVLGPGERLSGPAALALYLGPWNSPGGPVRTVTPGAAADLILLAQPLAGVLAAPSADQVVATMCAGRLHTFE